MSKFLKYLVQGRKIFDTQFGSAYLKAVIVNRFYMPVLQLHKNGKSEDFVFKSWTFRLVAHDISESVCKNSNISYCNAILLHDVPYYRFYFLLAEDKASDREYLIPVDTYTFVWADNDISSHSECFRENWLRDELNMWVAGLCNTDADITEWRYRRGFFAWWNRLIYNIVRCDYD